MRVRRPHANGASEQSTPRRREKKTCYEISRECTSNRRGESEFGGRLARSWSRSTYAGRITMLDGVIGIQPTPSRQQYQALVQRTEDAVKTQTLTQAQRDKYEQQTRGATGF